MGKSDKKKLLLIGYRAYGDWVYTVPILPSLFDEYEVHLDVNMKGYELLHDDPRFASVTLFEIEKIAPENYVREAKARWAKLEDELKPDKVINLWRSLESKVIWEANQDEFWLDKEARTKALSGMSMYECVFDHVNMELHEDQKLDCFHFTDEQLSWGNSWRQKHKGDFLVLVQLVGSSAHKVYPETRDMCYAILDSYPSAQVYVIGDPGTTHIKWPHERITHVNGTAPIKQVLLMVKHADIVIGPESVLPAAAGMWGTHKVMLCTSSSIHDIAHLHKNDMSLQSSAECSPCHRAIYGLEHCDGAAVTEHGDNVCSCIFGFKMADIMDRIEKAYEDTQLYNKGYLSTYENLKGSGKCSALQEFRWGLVRKYCPSDSKVLDYGCGAGAFLGAASNGFSVSGYDINPFSAYNEKPYGEVDVMTMWDVIEHIEDPAGILEEFQPEWLILSTPNAASHCAAADFEGWIHHKPGEHLVYYTESGLREKLGSLGYEICEIGYTEGEIRSPESPDNILTVVAKKMDSRGWQ
jgi:ADP-heptose:LPS heptosyltransferase